jgi:putative hydrolase of the HAD superfamily
MLGMITNMDSDMRPLCDKLGLSPYIDVIVTSGEVGSDKPKPQIFREALKRAGVTEKEAVHVGDQYRIDVEGARNAGISPILLDRYGQYADIEDCPRISTLSEVYGILK